VLASVMFLCPTASLPEDDVVISYRFAA